MIKTPTRPDPLGTRLKNDELIFTSSDPMKSRVPVDDYSIIVCEHDPKKYVSTLFNCFEFNQVKYPYYLQHLDLFENAQKIFTDCFGVEPDVIIAYAYKKDYTKSSFLFANRKMIENALEKKDNKYVFNLNNSDDSKSLIKRIKDETQLRELKYLTINQSELHVTLPYRFFPVIGTSNDLKFDSNPNFALIFGSFLSEEIYQLTKEEETLKKDFTVNQANKNRLHYNDDSNPNKWVYHFDDKLKEIFGSGIPLYCIKKFDLHNPNYIAGKLQDEDDLHPFDLFKPWDVDPFYSATNRQAVTKFNDVIVRLLLGYNRAAYLPIDIDEFESTMADFYELDRTPKTVQHSQSLQGRLKRKYKKSRSFARNIPSLSVKHFIEYFILESIIDFDKFFQDPAKELKHAMAERDETNKLIGPKQILSSFLANGKPNDEYREFIKGQSLAKKNIARWTV